VALTISASNLDSRGIAIASSERRACETACGDGPNAFDCLASCAEEVPLQIYVANRAPATLLVGRIHTSLLRQETKAGEPPRVTAAYHSVVMHGAVPLDIGPSNVRVGQVVDESGQLVDRVFAVAFDARSVFVIDPKLAAVETIIRTGRGPQELAVDSGFENGQAYSHAYLAHFTDSYLGIVDLDLRRPATYGHVIASLGAPQPPAEAR
jgi:hypothetical protein